MMRSRACPFRLWPTSLAVAVLPAFAVAQSSYSYSPPNLAAQESSATYHEALGVSSDGRCMLMDGGFRGQPMRVKEVAFRPSWVATGEVLSRRRAAGYFGARRWSNVKLRMSRCDLTQSSRTFAKNPTSGQTLVFDGPTSWPAVDAIPKVQPMPFSIRFPFRQTWVHTGAEDICMDFDFTGGVLSATGNWPSLARYLYPLSSFIPGGHQASGSSMIVGDYTPGYGCVDSSSTSSFGAVTSGQVATYNDQYIFPRLRRTMQLTIGATRVFGNVAMAIGIDGSFAGVPFPGVSCNRLHVDLAQPSVVVLGRAENGFYSTNFLGMPWQSTFVGAAFWGQAAWLDSVTRQPRLASAMVAPIPELPPVSPLQRLTLLQRDPKLKYGEGFPNAWWKQPVIRYLR